MSSAVTIALLLAAVFVIGAVVGWLAWRGRARRHATSVVEVYEARVAGAEEALEAAREGAVRLEADLTTALDDLEPFRGELKRLRAWVAEVDEVLGGTAKEVRALVADRADLQLRLLDTDDVLESKMADLRIVAGDQRLLWDEAADLGRAVGTAERDLEVLRAAPSSMADDLNALREVVDRLEAEIDVARTAQEELQARLSESDETLARQSESTAHALVMRSEMDARMDEIEALIVAGAADVGSMVAAREELIGDLGALEREVIGKTAELGVIEDRHDEILRLLAEVQDGFEQRVAAVGRAIEEALDAKESDLERWDRQRAGMLRELEESRSHLEESETELLAARREESDLRTRLTELETELQRLSDEADATSANLAAKDSALADERAARANVESALEDARQERMTASQGADERAVLERKIADLESALATAREERVAASPADEERAALEERIAGLEEQLAAAASREEEALERREDLHADVARTEQMARPVTVPVRPPEPSVEAADETPREVSEQAETPREDAPASIDEAAATRDAAIVALRARFEADASDEPDDLTAVAGIGRLLERMLNTVGIRTYRDLVSLTTDDVAHLAVAFASQQARIDRVAWIEGARAAHLEEHGEDLGVSASAAAG